MRKTLSAAILLLMSCICYGRDFFYISESRYVIKAPDVKSRLERVITSPENILKRYTPEGAKILKKVVEGNQIRFTARKTILLVSKTAVVNGTLEIFHDLQSCLRDQSGYLITFDLAGSSDMIINNIVDLKISVCAKEESNTVMSVSVKGKMYKADAYGGLDGIIVRDIIEAQVAPLMKSLAEEINGRK